MTEETTALALRSDENLLAPVADLDTILRAYQLKKEFIEHVLHKGLDYGTIPGTTKDTLYKPGAEKMANLYGFSPSFVDVATIEDWNGEDHNGEPFFYYRQKCNLYKKDRLIGSADGSCNSWEKKYRYREGQRKCPECGQPTIFKSKLPKTGFYCWAKKGGCGAQFKDGDKRITEQDLGQIKNPDICDMTNTILKMAQKRALIAAILITTGASDYFTQDVEDFIDGDFEVSPEAQPGKQPTSPLPADPYESDYPLPVEEAQVATPTMSLETAEAVTNSKGVKYGLLDSATLSHMTKGINDGLKKEGLTIAQKEEYHLKLDAIRTILAHRNGGQ